MTKERLQQLIEVLDMTRKLISIDIYLCIYDTNCIVQYIYPDDGDKDGIHVGQKFIDPTGKLEEVLATQKCIHNYIPMDRFGFFMEGNLIPVYEDGELCGAISTAYVPMNQQQLAAREQAVRSIYYLILSIDMKNNNHINRLYFDYARQQFPTDAQHFDDFCEKTAPYIHPEDLAQFRDFSEISRVWERLQSERTFAMECRLLSASGEYRWAELIFTRTDELAASDMYNYAVFMVRDIHDRKSTELAILQRNQELIAQLEKNNQLLFEQGMTDELTKLYNRKGLAWFGESLLKKAKKSDLYIYALVADLNGLKYINDRFGHEEGDRAIRKIAGFLRDAAPDGTIVSRTGGDEFTVMAMLEKDSPLPAELEAKLLRRMKDFNARSGLPYLVEASYGWDARPAVSLVNLDDCVKRADDRMYDMKSRQRMSDHLSVKVREEIDRRFGSEKQNVFVLSADGAVQREIRELFDSDHLFTALEAPAEAARLLDACDDAVILIVDNRLEGQSGVSFVRDLPEAKRRNVIPILLMEREDPDAIAEAFEAGVEDVLLKPYGSVLNRSRIRQLIQLRITNQKLTQMLEQHVVR